MKNKYLTNFMPLTWVTDPKKITITFQAEIYNNQILVHKADRIGNGYALCIYEIIENEEENREKMQLSKETHTLNLPKIWDDISYEDHLTTLVIMHNPSADSDSMATTDAPNMN